MYRACSTWQYEVVGHLIEQHLRGLRLGYVTGECYTESQLLAAAERGNAHRAWRVLKSHEGHRSFARALGSGAALAVYAYRDIRDVVLSLKHKRAKTFEALLRSGMVHQILANDRFWRAQPKVLVQRYEELITDPVTGVVQLARHLGLGVTRREAAQIADEYSLEANQTRIESLRHRLLEAGFDLEDPSNQQICDPITLLHWNHLRTGHKNPWRTEATPQYQALIARLCGAWLRAHGYETDEMTARVTLSFHRRAPLGAPGELDLALGCCAALLRKAAARCPRFGLLIKRLVGLRADLPQRLAWSVGEPYIGSSELRRDVAVSGYEPAMIASCPVGS
jgi:hypothetical protein